MQKIETGACFAQFFVEFGTCAINLQCLLMKPPKPDLVGGNGEFSEYGELSGCG